MARVFIDGFEAQDLSLWDVTEFAVVSAAQPGMTGSYCLNLNYNATVGTVLKTLPASAEYYFAFKIRMSNTDAHGILFVRNGNTVIGRIVTSGGLIKVYSGASLRATGTKPLAPFTTYLMEIRYKVGDADGIIQVKVNGLIDVNYSGDTQPGADTQINTIFMGREATYVTYAAAYYDDFIVDNSSWIGNTFVQLVRPTGAGTSTQWTPSAGANYECVDETPYDDVDFISTNIVDKLDFYAMSNLTGEIGSIKCVQARALAKQEGTPDVTNLKLAVRTGGVDHFSADLPIGTALTPLLKVWEANPETTNPWTEAQLNDIELGVKAAA
jgi:hypothetical protein